MQDDASGRKTKFSVHRLYVSDDAMELMIRAIANLSRANRRFETLRDVVLHVLNTAPEIADETIERFRDLLPLDGQTRIFLRVNQDEAAALEELKDELTARSLHTCNVRDAVCFCCLQIAGDQV